MGLLNKLLELKRFDALHFVVDDSERMLGESDAQNEYGEFVSRWEETRMRLIEMLEILAHIPSPPVMISFLNRPMQLSMDHEHGANPKKFHDFCVMQINMVWEDRPSRTTPYLERMKQVFQNARGKHVSWYFFGDGVPDGGEETKRKIEQLIVSRPKPKDNPITFLSCTTVDEDVAWMKDLEEAAPYCSEYDDYQSEKREVLSDQGMGLPFTRGFYLIGSLVAAMNPEDLDAMDESVPFTKYALDNLLGSESEEEDYKHYYWSKLL